MRNNTKNVKNKDRRKQGGDEKKQDKKDFDKKKYRLKKYSNKYKSKSTSHTHLWNLGEITFV